jgi:hypothetical protein
MGCCKKLYATEAMPQTPVRVPNQWSLYISVTSVPSVGDIEVIQGMCTDIQIFT